MIQQFSKRLAALFGFDPGPAHQRPEPEQRHACRSECQRIATRAIDESQGSHWIRGIPIASVRIEGDG